MGKSPGKWIKTVLFGKKLSKSNLSKDAPLEKKTSNTINSRSKDLDADSMVISCPERHVIDVNREPTSSEKSSNANLLHDTSENVIRTIGLSAANDDELTGLEQAATTAQAAFRGYLARRAFWALKGIIRLQALVRGHLVRRQAVVTLSCMRAIIEFQALVRGQRVRQRLSANGPQILQKRTPEAPVLKEQASLLQTSLKSEKLSTNAFGAKLVNSANTIMPLSIQYDPTEPNSVKNWLERWSSSHFWEPLLKPKQTLVVKPKRKQTKLHRVPAPNLKSKYNNSNLFNTSGHEKMKRTARKAASTLQPGSAQEQSDNENEKVKHNLRKISVSAVGDSKMSEVESNEVNVILVKHPDPEALQSPPLEDKLPDVNPNVDPPVVETNGKVENVESTGKENQKTRWRKSLSVNEEHLESNSHTTPPTVPSYMAATESAKSKQRAQAAAKAAEDGGENGFVRRHSLPSSLGKLGLQSPHVQKPLQANGKGGSKTNKSQMSPRDGWRR